ncbi:hypothetical protein [Arthrobacter globiformis]|uniref:Hpt domain-containing protein n=1 Tax=Arthrobacter globiformis TaxID=1665 RepID=A0A328HJ91_ARTGO|nr:hypothetical protein [Arthrobacter globiformis]RAM37300.1 hypothetical protein DBZ45_10830 [Arthrobacter globiformis]
MMPDSDRDLPVLDNIVLDSIVLQELSDDAGEAAAQAFMEEYLLLLLARAVRIFKAFAREDAAESLDAVLSLRASSQMAGALRLASYTHSLEPALKRGEIPQLAAVKAELSAHIRWGVLGSLRRSETP